MGMSRLSFDLRLRRRRVMLWLGFTLLCMAWLGGVSCALAGVWRESSLAVCLARALCLAVWLCQLSTV